MAAALAVLNAALTPKVAYDFDDIPATRPADYVEVSLHRRFGGESRASGQKWVTGYRLAVRSVSQASVSDARLMRLKAKTALESKFLTVSGETSTPIQFESEDPIGPDDGWYSGLTLYTFTI